MHSKVVRSNVNQTDRLEGENILAEISLNDTQKHENQLEVTEELIIGQQDSHSSAVK